MSYPENALTVMHWLLGSPTRSGLCEPLEVGAVFFFFTKMIK